MAIVAWHALSNFYYLVSPIRGGNDVRQFLLDLTRFVSVAPGNTCIVTRNVKGFRASPIPARRPAEFMMELE